MKKLCALAASLIIGAASFGAQAGDRDRHDHGHKHGHYDRHHDRNYDRHDRHHHHRHDHDHRRYVTYREYRPVYYRPAPVYYYPEPAYRERVRYRDDDGVSGWITIGF